MRLELIHLDDAFVGQRAFLDACAERRAVSVDATADGPRVRLWGYDADLARLEAKLGASAGGADGGPVLAFLGSGDFHHVSAMLIARAAATGSRPFTVVHFDNHPDWVRCSSGMHCGSWVNRALGIPNVAKIVTVGVCSKDLQHPEWKGGNLAALKEGRLELFPFAQAPSKVSGDYGAGASHRQEGGHVRWTCIEDIGLAAFGELLLSRIETADIYITLDKDALAPADAVTNWDQGKLSLDDVLRLIGRLAERHIIVGADVVGDYSAPAYAGGVWPYVRKWGESIIDHPRVALAASAVAATNEATNLRLLDAFTEAMRG
ncbi:hypothetical protein Rvan_0985 [Rhodomicrobium vannielii ATCC 17100]|uniref:Arginase/agmatinase/formiminoglutamase n=1 Tax=Rhodomicrobium vannielii (strain ATCC 17100 / DSM 162 / LMG 4299 / NCIMB 10020 / ATH 3.1.1) TaxID=648757 RepID=E3I2H5_RHOVT|nr:arginase family protein [Rhodomicrobium vannielii]ADP70259.1 hypothetical protein Rvan_0985 [Rhodomicrobium vannielii ATCC 17100]